MNHVTAFVIMVEQKDCSLIGVSIEVELDEPFC